MTNDNDTMTKYNELQNALRESALLPLLQVRRNKLAPEVNAHNREALFAALTAAGARTVTVFFDGAGDEGQVESIDAYRDEGEDAMELPTTPVTIQTTEEDWRSNNCQVKEQTEVLASAIETVCYECLEQTHPGWEISDGEVDGASGTFTFDVAPKTITLDFNQRVENVVEYEHEF